MITEAPYASPVASAFDSQVGFAIRRWCAPLLDLPAHAPADAYWDARTRLGNDEVTRRLLRATGTSAYLLDTGLPGDDVLDVEGHAAASQATVREVVRLETVAESLLAETGSSDAFVDGFAGRLREVTANAVGVKSILAYRHGFDIAAARPSADEARAGADATLHAAGDDGDRLRVTDAALLRHLVWCGVDLGLPIQLHTGYGDRDLDLHRANPILLTSWLREVESTGVPVMLLHCYPYHREAGYLAQVFDNVYFDVGLAIGYTGAQSPQVVAESLELAPFHKQLYSSDGYGPAELHLLGSVLWRCAVAEVLGGWVTRGDWSADDAARVVRLVGSENARRVYRLA
jgi:uncharacterized protein